MPTKPLPLIALVLFVPVAVLTFFAVRSLSLENDALSVRRERLAKQRADAAAALVLARLQGLGTKVLAQTQSAFAAGGVSALSTLTRKRVFTYAYVSKSGTALYSAMAFEHQYDMARRLQDKAQLLTAKLSQSEPSGALLVPYGGGYTLLRCAKSVGGVDICVAVDKAKVDLVLGSELLPVAHRAGLSRIALVDPGGAAFGPNDLAATGVTSHPLTGVLKGWQLRAEEPRSGNDELYRTVFLYFISGAFIAGWLLMTWMLHRSNVLKEDAAEARANVIAQLAHELRTPLANLKLHTDLLSRTASEPAAVKQYSVVLHDEIDRLSLLAENAIAVARGAIIQPKLATAVPDDCLKTILARFGPTLKEAQCDTQFSPGADKACVFDRTSWERCIVNLIDNARKYAPGSTIKISTTQTEDLLRLDVHDNGPGISRNQRDKIFEPLARGPATKASGFGLGLAAVRTLARQNGGECWLEPTPQGAYFVVTMKVGPAETAKAEHAS